MKGKPMRRDCPRDHTPLKPEQRKRGLSNVTIDACSECDGIFLDVGEIRKLTGNRDLNALLTKYLGIDTGSQLVCPSCGGLMDDEKAGDVILDVCISCKGVWLDTGELKKLAESKEDFSKLSPEKWAEVYDEMIMKKRASAGKGLLGGLFGPLRRR
ncbi:MAG: zf-TFIIB domain-containing protein [Euryarchaeota archaeon]|nr:zf-TFIIB domain-containing protein [Euryarchaeota archaeon]